MVIEKKNRVWRDNWIPWHDSYKPISQQGRCLVRFVSQLLHDNGSWKQDLLNQYFMPWDISEIVKVRASPRSGDDVLTWGLGKLGVFSVKSAYDFAFQELCNQTATTSSTNLDGRRSCWNMIWKCNVPPTVMNFAWRVAINSLPTWQNKHKRGLELSACNTPM